MDEMMDDYRHLTTKGYYDYRLIRKAIDHKDESAYAELLNRYRESVYFMVYKMTGNKDDAEDLVMEAFTRAFSKLHQYEPKYAFSTWLFRIATNVTIDFLRKKKNENTISLSSKQEGTDLELEGTISSNSPTPDLESVRKQKIQIIKNVIDKLKPKYRELIILFYYEELSHEEISKKLNLPIGTIKAQLFRARELMMQLLKNLDIK
ncbi:MAG: sigma-70 family RNA polymerase sigma factor [Bacteroidia bacterium]|nr:sigma-70 family RNA polymerase sigma factor [Bacteroidia bacterium]